MRATRVTPNLRVADIETAKNFYADYLGLSTEEFNLGWVARYTSPETGAHVQLVTGTRRRPRTRSSRSTRRTSTPRTTRRSGSATRSCTR
jgi:catechol 2,3-dioxygenase-like lactoylglutathione lyase family enzyme